MTVLPIPAAPTPAAAPGFTLGPFAVDRDGALAPRDVDLSPGFVFTWRDRTVHARLSGAPAGTPDTRDGALALELTLGRVPSSALVETASQRARSLALLRSLPPLLPAGWRMRLLADHRIHLRSDTPLTLPVTATALITQLTRFLLALSPYLDLLDEGGVASGKAKL